METHNSEAMLSSLRAQLQEKEREMREAEHSKTLEDLKTQLEKKTQSYLSLEENHQRLEDAFHCKQKVRSRSLNVSLYLFHFFFFGKTKKALEDSEKAMKSCERKLSEALSELQSSEEKQESLRETITRFLFLFLFLFGFGFRCFCS